MKSNPTPLSPGSLAERLALLQQTMASAQRQSAVAARAVELVAASKTQPAAVLAEAIGLGIIHFGENRVQEAAEKWPALKAAHPQVRLHLIGPLQSNKAADAVALFDVIETIDREKIALAVAEEARTQKRAIACYIQVNTGEEAQKGGVAPRELPSLLAYCRGTARLNVTGLMCIPPAGQNPAPHFALLKTLADENGLSALSMGMSEDAPTAIRLGATAVRIGTRLFGARQG